MCRALKAKGTQLHAYQAGADSRNELMGSSAQHIDSIVRLSSVPDSSETSLGFIRGEMWQFWALQSDNSMLPHSYKEPTKKILSGVHGIILLLRDVFFPASDLNFVCR